MNYKLYNLLFGGILLTGLYFSLDYFIHALIVLVFAEGITGVTLAALLANIPVSFLNDAPPKEFRKPRPRFLDLTADRLWRFLVGAILILSFLLFYNELWFIPWFLGFAIFGAGVSGVCPMLAAIKATGIR